MPNVLRSTELLREYESDDVKVLRGPQEPPKETPRPVRVRPPKPQVPATPAFAGRTERLYQGNFTEVQALQGPQKAEARKQDYTKDFRKLADKMKLSDADRSELLAAVSKWIAS
jgi:hypothetical protein